MNKQRIAVLTIASIGVLATFMPWASIPILGSMSGIQNPIGKISLALFIIPLITCLIGDKMDELKSWQQYLVIVPSVLAVLLDIFQIIAFKNAGEMTRNPFASLIARSMSIGFGLYLAILTGILLPAFMLLMKDAKKAKLNNIAQADSNNAPFGENQEVYIIEEEINTIIEIETEESNIDKEDHNRFMPK